MSGDGVQMGGAVRCWEVRKVRGSPVGGKGMTGQGNREGVRGSRSEDMENSGR